MTKGIIGRKIGNRGRTVINCSKSGAKIKDIYNMATDFVSSSAFSRSVDQVVLLVGVNDIRHARDGVGILEIPMQKLVADIKINFPSS